MSSPPPPPPRHPAPRGPRRVHAAGVTGACCGVLAVLLLPGSIRAQAAEPPVAVDSGTAGRDSGTEPAEIIVTSRRREEQLQDVPIAVAVVDAALLERTGNLDIRQVTQLVPTLQLISSNPRNTSVTIRGLGSSFGLTNDGLEPGVGVYVDGIYNARPAAATFDLLDIERLEVLRGPQGTLFGKNTTAGAVNITTRAPTFAPEAKVYAAAGTAGLVQGQASFGGGLLGETVAGRLSLGVTRRDGFLDNVTTGVENNEVNNATVRGQLLFALADGLDLRLIADYSRQNLDECCTQVYVRTGTTLRAADRQFDALAASRGYTLPGTDAWDRRSDVEADLQADQWLGGLGAILDWDAGPVTLTSITSWRAWDWDPSNDRDFISLPILTLSQNASRQDQHSQEFQVNSSGSNRVDYTAGLYFFRQTVDTTGASGWGADASFWLIGPTVPDALLDGYRADFTVDSSITSYAAYAQATWNVTDRVHVTPGLRYSYERKDGIYDQVTSGGLATSDPNLVARRNGIARDQFYSAALRDGFLTGQLNVAFDVADDALVYATAALGEKSGGINLNGIPTDALGNPSLPQAEVAPEQVTTVELGAKTQLLDRLITLNVAAFHTDIRDYQTNVVDTGPGAVRGYLANADRVRVQGVELETSLAQVGGFSGYASLAWTDGEYKDFANAPCPLERIGNTTAPCDLSGQRLPVISAWAVSAGAEYARALAIAGGAGEAYVGVDASYRSDFSSDASNSRFQQVDAYALANLRAGYRSDSGRWEVFGFVRNAFDAEYLLFTSAQPGNSGAVFGQPGDPRTAGLAFRINYGTD